MTTDGILINIRPYSFGNVHKTKDHFHLVLQGKLTVIYITDKKRIIQTFHKHEIIPIIGDIPHFTINNTGKWVKLKLMYLAPTGRQLIIKKLQPEILFFTGFSCKEYLYKNMINFLKNRINEHFSSFLKIKKKITTYEYKSM